jgi:ABC-type Mn2+/Zn2+ transport system ATPase subunit
MRLQCRHIRFNYPGTLERVFEDLSLTLAEPGFHALFGPSGVGKSSLALILSGAYPVSGGEVETSGIETLFYSHNLERLPGWSSIGRHLDRITPAHHKALKNELVDIFGITALLKKRFGQLSLGQQNRINLVRYLVQDFQMLIMDESLANVDEKTRGDIIMALKDKFPQVIFLYISHNMAEVARYCRQIWVLHTALECPQAVAVRGQDLTCHHPVAPQALEKTMLEIMGAG